MDLVGRKLADAHAGLRQATDWLLARQPDRPQQLAGRRHAGLRMFGIVTGGWLLAQAAAAAQRALDEGRDSDFLRQKLVTARFYAEQVLPQAAGLVPSVTAGPSDLLAAAF